MRKRRQLLPTVTILAGAGLLIAGVYDEIPPALGMFGVAMLFAGGWWALWRSGADRREHAAAHWASVDASGGAELSHSHGGHHGHGGGHHGGFDGGGGFGGHGGGGHGGGH
jgi:hypothetical protein